MLKFLFKTFSFLHFQLAINMLDREKIFFAHISILFCFDQGLLKITSHSETYGLYFSYLNDRNRRYMPSQ